jgi:hypothetical protein
MKDLKIGFRHQMFSQNLNSTIEGSIDTINHFRLPVGVNQIKIEPILSSIYLVPLGFLRISELDKIAFLHFSKGNWKNLQYISLI